MYILGISCFYHDAAAALLDDGKIIAASQEERFTRRKHDQRFPVLAVKRCLEQASIGEADVAIVAYYDKPFLKLERLLETFAAYAPRGLMTFLTAMPSWIKRKLWIEDEIRKALPGFRGEIVYAQHHESHAASAFFPSPFEDAAVLTVDGVGEWATTTIAAGHGRELRLLEELRFPHSLGLLYSAFTYYLGFKVNSGEYKVMGLAPYGTPRFTDLIREKLIDLKEDGSFRLDMRYFDYPVGLKMTNAKFDALFGGPRRLPESPLTQREMDIAASLQAVTEEVMLRLARRAKAVTGSKNLCLAGGVALNCVANGKILRSNLFERLWIQPASGDAGGALGAAYVAWYSYLEKPRTVSADGDDLLQGSYLGPAYEKSVIKRWLDENRAVYRELPESEVAKTTAELLAAGNVVGFFRGRMEFGPRALGARSILADPRNREMQSKLNLKIKFRESFRPFAPSIIAERASEWFKIRTPSPYMLLTADVADDKRIAPPQGEAVKWGIDWLKVPKSVIPAVTHVDHSARLQTVDGRHHPAYRALLEAFLRLTGCPVLVNTSFNVRGEPIVESPQDAYRCFMRTGMDYLLLENFLLAKSDQPALTADSNWQKEYELD